MNAIDSTLAADMDDRRFEVVRGNRTLLAAHLEQVRLELAAALRAFEALGKDADADNG
jgi:hypothetical protein